MGRPVPDGVLGDDDMTKKLQKLEGHLLRKSRVDEELRPLNAVLQMLCYIIRITHTYIIYVGIIGADQGLQLPQNT